MNTGSTGAALLIGLLAAGHSVAEDGYEFGAVYTGEINRNADGGLATGTSYLDNLDLTLEIDIAATFGTAAGRVFLYGMYNNGTTFADRYVGDLQVTSNIDAPEGLRLFEAWYEYGEGPWSLRTGLYDLNSEFDAHDTGGLFLNSSQGIGPDFSQTGRNGPSIFPISSLTIRGAWQGEHLAARVAVLDGVPGDPDDPASNEISLGGDEGALLVAEADVPLSPGGRAWVGYWQYTESFERIDGTGRSDDNAGWYAGIEQGFELAGWRGSAFLRYGQANDDLNPVADYLGAGVVIDSPLPARGGDQLGLAIASAGVGSPYRDSLGNANRRETTWELTYRAVLNDTVAIQPDLQYVVNPAADASLDNALVLALRFEIAY